LRTAGRWLRDAQAADGSFAPRGDEDPIAATAWATEALGVTKQSATDPAVRRAAEWLVARQEADGAFAPSSRPMSAAARRRTAARALRALLLARVAREEAIGAAVAFVVTAFDEGESNDRPSFNAGARASEEQPARWEECWEILEALALYEAI